MEIYNLDIVLAVGYRTNSSKAILFRKWGLNLSTGLFDYYT
ncbi:MULTISPECIES: RhuM family protein [Francisellaceae]|uniref:Uncharacterized protein n=1 Tax=Allofrancisella frigidaquae TaxID=1085644 RepID=A0A6M3HVM5_9GAMM|nr:hypothetical protein E3E15_06750 [Allofrancisella frigidaquae]